MAAQWEHQQRNGPARRRLLLPGVLVVLGLAGLLFLPEGSRPAMPVIAGDPVRDDPPAVPVVDAAPAGGRWAVVDGGPLSARDGATVVAGGDKVVVWGGRSLATARHLRDGAIYDATTDSWRAIPDAPLEGRSYAVAAWTGEALLVWGGVGSAGVVGDGAAFDPDAGRWHRLPPARLSPRRDAHAVWARGRLVVWGGTDAGGGPELADGAAYDPRRRRWEPIPEGPLSGRRQVGVSLVATDEGAFVWSSDGDEAVVAMYDPQRRHWRTLHTPRLDPGAPVAFAGVDGNVLAWGRATIGDRGPLALMFTTSPDWWATVARPPLTPEPGQRLVGGEGTAASWSGRGPGIVFDALGNRWEAMVGAPRPAAVGWPDQVWVDDRLFVWHGLAQPRAERRGVTWEASSPWRLVGDSPVPIADAASTLWTGWLRDQQQVLVWGGERGAATNAGAAYDPELGLWETMPDAPVAARFDHAAVFTGTRMVVLGGWGSDRRAVTDAAAYLPSRRIWQRLPAPPVHVTRSGAAWSGENLFVAGFRDGRMTVAELGARDDSWHKLPAPPTAAVRGTPHVIWTGFETWVWTTTASGAGAGAAWDPVDQRWRRLPALPGLFGDAAVTWAGRRMFLVDREGTTASLGRGTEGWRRHPASPVAEERTELAWTGRRLVAYGPLASRMASLDPRGGAWAETIPPPVAAAENARLLWTGRHLLVFGGGSVAMQGGLQDL